MPENLPPPSTQTATPNQSLSPLNQSPPRSSSAIPSSTPTIPSTPSAATAPTNGIAAAEALASPTHTQAEPTPKAEPAAEEEPYTIKCICGYQGDDGNTIYCEICDSWQHIECFYPNNSEEATREEFAHACHECKPRPLDVAHAVLYQQQRLNAASTETPATQKPKRPPSKSHGQSHKKKTKPNDLQLNGHAASTGDVLKHPMSAHDSHHSSHPSAKKTKSSHKSSHSVGGSRAKRSPSYSASRTSLQNGHPLSPATTPPDLPGGVEIHNYSNEFLSLCNEQDAVQTVQTNSFASLAVSNATSIWLREPERMLKETGHKFTDVFQALPQNIDTIKCLPRVEMKKRIFAQDTTVRWRYLVTPVTVDKDVPLIELNGQIGFQNDYCAIPTNRYEELSCPLPFVFFHPMLPLCIDTRREGSLARYVRRSCRPNAVLDTFLSGGSEYHFWLVSDRHIDRDEQITIPWDFGLPRKAKAWMLRPLGLGDDEGNDDIDVDEDEYNIISRWVYLLLSEYGGCACELGSNCAFARFHRNYGSKIQQARISANSHTKKKAARKVKGHAMSPTSTGHATNSRAVSEGHFDEYPENDKASMSSRSKPPSRDMTPAPRQGSFDTLGILTEPTDRDKRKVAMVEDSFRRLEQQPPRKKKRTSDGTSASEKQSSSHSKSKSKSSVNHYSVQHGDRSESMNGTTGRHYADAGTSRSKSGSPLISISPRTGSSSHGFPPGHGHALSYRRGSTGPPPSYCDASVQTDPTEDDWFSEKSPAPVKKRRVISLSKRLLSCHLRQRVIDNSLKTQIAEKQPIATATLAMDVDASSTDHVQTKRPGSAKQTPKVILTDDVPMVDASNGSNDSNGSEPSGAIAKTVSDTNVNGSSVKKSPDLRVQLPKIPSFHDVATPLVTSVTGALSSSPVVQSPFAIASASPFSSTGANGTPVTPSPIKKKMSLSDYTKSRKAAACRPLVSTPLKPSVSNAEDSKPATGIDGAAATGDSPTAAEKSSGAISANPILAPTTTTSLTTPTPGSG